MMKRKSHLLGNRPGLILAFAAMHHDDKRKSDKPKNTPDEKNPYDAPKNDDIDDGNVPAEIPTINPPEEDNDPIYDDEPARERNGNRDEIIPGNEEINTKEATIQHHNKNALDSRSSSVKEGSDTRGNRKS